MTFWDLNWILILWDNLRHQNWYLTFFLITGLHRRKSVSLGGSHLSGDDTKKCFVLYQQLKNKGFLIVTMLQLLFVVTSVENER